MKQLRIIVAFLVAVFLSIQVWAWSDYVLNIIANLQHPLVTIAALFTHIGVQELGLKSFAIMIVPASLLYFSLVRNRSLRVQLFVFIGFGMVAGSLFYLSVFGLFYQSILFTIKHAAIAIFSGAVAGFSAWGMQIVFASPKFAGPVQSDVEPHPGRRRILVSLGSGLGGMAMVASGIGPIRIMRNASKHLDVDASKLADGELMAVQIDDNPVWILKRSTVMLDTIGHPPVALTDPISRHSLQPAATRNRYRSIDPQYFVVYAICTHLGCSLTYLRKGNPQISLLRTTPQFFCPCHGSVFDLAGRVFDGSPAPTNLQIPNYEMHGSTVRLFYPNLGEVWRGIA